MPSEWQKLGGTPPPNSSSLFDSYWAQEGYATELDYEALVKSIDALIKKEQGNIAHQLNEPSPFMKHMKQLDGLQKMLDATPADYTPEPYELPASDFSDDLTSEEVETITDWLNNPEQVHANVMVIARRRNTGLGCGWDESGPLPQPVMNNLQIYRVKQTFRGASPHIWTADIAFRSDTGEPVVMVTHEGDYRTQQ